MFSFLLNSRVILSKNILTDEDPLSDYWVEQIDGSPPPSWLDFVFPHESASGNLEISGTFPDEEIKYYDFLLFARDIDNMIGNAPFYIQTQRNSPIHFNYFSNLTFYMKHLNWSLYK